MSERLNAFSVKTCCGDKDTIDWVDYDLDCINVLCIINVLHSATFPLIFDRSFRFMEISATNERK